MLRCIKNSVDAGHVTLEEGQAVQKRIDDVLRSGIGPTAARDLVAKELEAEAFERKRRALLTEARRQVLEPQVLGFRNASGQHDPAEALVWLHEHHGQAAFDDAETRRLTILADAHAKMEGVLFEFRKGALTGDKRRLYGETKARLDNVVRELFGEDTGDQAAKELARAWDATSDDLRQRFNAAGGAIRKLEKWGLPQHHDAEALLKVGKERWIENILPLLDTERMVSQRTGAKLSPAELREALSVMWERITSDGWFDREPSGATFGKGAVFSQHADHRFLHFRNADAWLKYQRDFGEADPFAAMMGHVSVMARDIAHMEIFGPNPAAMREYLKQVVMKSASDYRPAMRLIQDAKAAVDAIAAEMKATPTRWQRLSGELDRVHKEMEAIRQRYRPQLGGKPSRRDRSRLDQLGSELMRLNKDLGEVTDQFGPQSADVPPELAARFKDALTKLGRLQERPIPWNEANPIDAVKKALHRADSMWDVMRGSYSAPVSSRMANNFATARSLVTAAALGSAMISALTDVASAAVRRKFVGLPSKAVVSDLVTMFRQADRREAVRAGLMLDSALHAMHSQARYVGGLQARNMAGYLADRVLALQGLSAWTQAAKHSFGMAMQAEFADRVAIDYAALPDALRNTLQRHGLTAGDWDQIRTAALYRPDPNEPDVTFLRPKEIAAAGGDKLAEKYTAMILRERRYAVPEGFVRSQTVLTTGRPGTFMGELTRNFAQFKSFTVAITMLHGGQVMREVAGGQKARGAKYAGGILIGGMLLGALVLQLREIAYGRDPRDMDNEAFWGAALLQSGGLGIYGDFFFAGVNRFGGGLTGTVAGPLVGRLDQFRNSTIGNVLKLSDEDANPRIGRDAVNLLRDWTPGGSLWYARLAYNRVLLEQLQMLVDPEAKTAWQRQMTKRKKDFGNEFWWAPGKAAPSRAPAF
jgi:hypothetical protein